MKEKIQGMFTKKKLLHALKLIIIFLITSILLLSLLGTVAHATGLVDDTISIHCQTINLIFTLTIRGAGFHGTGWTGLEKVCSMAYIALPILSGR